MICQHYQYIRLYHHFRNIFHFPSIPLFLNNYILYFYEIKSLLSSIWSNNNTNTNNNDISEGENYDMERLFVGNTIINNINTTIGPLSNPNNIVCLSSFHNLLQETKSKLLHHKSNVMHAINRFHKNHHDNEQQIIRNKTIRNQCGHCQKQTDIKNKG